MFKRLPKDEREKHLLELEESIQLTKIECDELHEKALQDEATKEPFMFISMNKSSRCNAKLVKLASYYEEMVVFYRFCDIVDNIDDELFNSIVECAPSRDSIDYWERCIESWTP